MKEATVMRWMVVIVGMAVMLRVVVALVHPFWFPDSADYDALGKAIAHGMPYEVNGLWATRMPGYPLLVGAVYAVGGPSVKTVLVLQAIFGGASSTWLVYLMGRRVSVGVGLVAAGLAAVDPLSVGFGAAFLSETAFTVLMLAALWMLVRCIERPAFRWWIGVGFVWAAAVYTRASALWLIVPLAGWLVWARSRECAIPHDPRTLRGAVLAVGIVIIGLIPWQNRNFSIFHEHFSRLTTLEGISLYEAVYPGADGGPKQDILPLPPEMVGMNESQRDVEWGRRAWAEVRADPARVAGLAVRKMGRTWSPWMNAAEFRSVPVQVAMVLWHVPLFMLAVIGIVWGRARWSMKGLLLIPMVYFTAMHALFLGSVRYRVPLMPLVCVFAAMGIAAIMRKRGVVNESGPPGSSVERRSDARC